MKKKTKKKKIKKSKKKQKKKLILNPIIYTIILVYILIIFLYFLNIPQEAAVQENTRYEGEKILKSIIYPTKTIAFRPSKQISGLGFIDVDVVDIENLKDFANRNYKEIKKSLGIKNDFCIHFEDKEGNLVDISPITGKKGIGVGSSKITFEVMDDSGNVIEVVECSI